MESRNMDRTPSTSSACAEHFPETGLHSLANEILSQVAEYLIDDAEGFTRLMLACRRMAGVCEYLRYTSLSVHGSRGQRLLATLISGSSTSGRYCARVKRIWFKFWHDAEMYLISTLMCEALALMGNLISLRIDAHSVDVTHTLNRMNRAGLIRSSHNSIFVLGTSSSTLGLFSTLTLPRIRNLMISGCYELSLIANDRCLEELNIESFLDYDDLANLLAGCEHTLLGQTLSVLSIKLVRSIDLRLVLPVMDRAFPNLKRCSLEQTAINFASVMETVGQSSHLFRSLNLLVLNRRLAHPLLKFGSLVEGGDATLQAVTDSLCSPSFIHPSLASFGWGCHLWIRSNSGAFHEIKGLNVAAWCDRHFGEQFQPEKYPSW